MKTNNKKAQITVFVIVGLVLLIIFIIFLLIRRSAVSETTQVKRVLNELETGSIRNHITNCVIQTAIDGLEKIGANGGVIYYFEGGTIPLQGKVLGQDYLNYTDRAGNPYFVAYGLKENTRCNQIISYEVPDYPYLGGSLDGARGNYSENCSYNSYSASDGSYAYPAYDGVYGQNTMSKLCYIIRGTGCKDFAKGIQTGLTIQKQLEDYIAKKLPDCVDFSAFSTRMPADIYQEADPEVEANIHEAEILFLVKYPVRISFEDQEPVTQMLNYQSTINVRLGAVYNFLYNAFTRDSKLIDFDINNQYIDSSIYYKEGLRLEKINNPCLTCAFPYNHDDIIEVYDDKFKIKGKPFFRVAVKNRRPALDLIKGVSQDISEGDVAIPITAFDPDDEPLTYYFLAQEPAGGCWREGTLIQNNALSINIQNNDVGNHYVGVLVVDDSGLFDYQKFWINITDMGGGVPAPISPCLAATCFWVKDADDNQACKNINSLDEEDYII